MKAQIKFTLLKNVSASVNNLCPKRLYIISVMQDLIATDNFFIRKNIYGEFMC